MKISFYSMRDLRLIRWIRRNDGIWTRLYILKVSHKHKCMCCVMVKAIFYENHIGFFFLNLSMFKPVARRSDRKDEITVTKPFSKKILLFQDLSRKDHPSHTDPVLGWLSDFRSTIWGRHTEAWCCCSCGWCCSSRMTGWGRGRSLQCTQHCVEFPKIHLHSWSKDWISALFCQFREKVKINGLTKKVTCVAVADKR